MIQLNILVLCNVDLEQKWGDYTRVFSLMHSLSKRGHKIFVMIIRPEPKKPRVEYLKEGTVEIIKIYPPRIGLAGKRGISRHLNYLFCFPKIISEAAKIIRDHRIDYIYSYMPGIGTSLPAMRIKSKHEIPLILDLADMYSMIRPKYVVKKSFKDADKILVITSYLKNILVKQGIDENKIFHVPNGVNLELFDPDKYSDSEISELRSNIGGEKLIVFAGSLQDLNIIIDSAEIVIRKYPSVKYLIIGDHRNPKKSKQSWENKANKKGIGKHFRFLGQLPRGEIPKYLLCADVCIDSFPDEPYYAAAHPIKLLEYGACGKPIVATRVSETSNMVTHSVFGLLAHPRNVEEYAEYIVTLLNNKAMGEQMGKEFATYVKSNFDWNKIAKDLEFVLTSTSKD